MNRVVSSVTAETAALLNIALSALLDLVGPRTRNLTSER